MSTGMAAPVPSKVMQYGSYPSSLPSSSRNSLSSTNGMYLASPASYSHPNERPLNSYSSSSFVMREEGDMREEAPRSHYTYPHYHTTHDPNMHSPTPPPAAPVHSHNSTQPRIHSAQRPDSSMSYTHRRALTETQAYTIGQGFPHLPNPTQIQQSDMHRLHTMDNSDQHNYRVAYGPDGRLNSIP